MRQNDPMMPPARGTKTLAWFMDSTGIFEKDQQQQESRGAAPIERRNSSSDESKSTTPPQHLQHPPPSSASSFLPTQSTNQRKQKRYRKTLSQHGAARKDSYAASQAMSESSEDGPQEVLQRLTTSSAAAAPGGAQNSDEYWFYDVATDGYYYEQNGAKGWRRRQPNTPLYKPPGKEQDVAHMNVNGPSKYNQLLAAQAAAAQAAFLHQAFQLQQSLSPSGQPVPSSAGPLPPQQQPTMRYYDPNSDGFFYEMASVDGWKRRQPNKPVSASVPAGITRPYAQRQSEILQKTSSNEGASYGAALARGQFPRNTVKQPQPESESGASSTCGDTFVELFAASDPVFNPIQRPSSLNLEQKAISPQLENAPTSTAALFEAVLADFGKTTTASSNNNVLPTPSTMCQQSPMKDSWNSFRSCSLFSPIKPSKRVLAPVAVAPTAPSLNPTPLIDDLDDDRMRMLLGDLNKLWTPVSGLNQA